MGGHGAESAWPAREGRQKASDIAVGRLPDPRESAATLWHRLQTATEAKPKSVTGSDRSPFAASAAKSKASDELQFDVLQERGRTYCCRELRSSSPTGNQRPHGEGARHAQSLQ